ncbi:MAG: hypothetical protein PHV82_15200 [Victivallaceae bacterium]|nr:hypothetical protein [Victivallaceae bacterium]
MAGAKNSKAGNSSDSVKTGNSCGFSLGCLVIVVAAGAVIFFLFIKPALEGAGYSCEDLIDKVFDFKEKAGSAISRSKAIYKDGKDKYEEVKNGAEDAVERGREIYRDGEDKYEEIKEKSGERVNNIKTPNPEEPEKLNQTAPKLIEDN